jgi:hypothetical protein
MLKISHKMNKLILLYLLSSITFSSMAQGNSATQSGHFTVNKKNNGTTQVLSVGDKLTIYLKSKNFVRGKMVGASRDYILVDSHEKIPLTDIKWIRKTKPSTGRVVGGVALTAVGTALYIPVLAGNVDLDKIAPQGAAGLALIVIGISVLTPPKYKFHKGDMITFKE